MHLIVDMKTLHFHFRKCFLIISCFPLSSFASNHKFSPKRKLSDISSIDILWRQQDDCWRLKKTGHWTREQFSLKVWFFFCFGFFFVVYFGFVGKHTEKCLFLVCVLTQKHWWIEVFRCLVNCLLCWWLFWGFIKKGKCFEDFENLEVHRFKD